MKLERSEIEALLPHRNPFLFLDEVKDLVPGVSGIGIHHVPSDAFWVPGHFPEEPIMPGVLISEAMAQVAGVVFMSANTEKSGQSLYLVGLEKFRFRRPVRPGDSLHMNVSVQEQRRSLWWFKAVATVNGKKVADGQLMATSA